MSPWVPFLIGITGPVLIGFALGLIAARFLRWSGGMRNQSNDHQQGSLRRLEDRLLAVENQIATALKLLACGLPSSGLHVREFHGRSHKMATAPPVNMIDSERVLLSVRPRKSDGTIDNTVTYTWTSSDSVQVGTDVLPEHGGLDAEGLPITIPNTHEAYATTPLDAGSATVTATPSARYTTDTILVSYVPGQPGASNLSAGTPVPD